MVEQETLRSRLLKRRNALKTEREDWREHWEELGDFVLPRRLRFSDRDDKHQRGKKLNSRIVDSTATFALRTLVAGLMTGVTSPARPWFKLTPRSPGLAEMPEVSRWLHAVTLLMRDIFAASNVYNALTVGYEDLGLFGTTAIYIEPDFDDVIRLRPMPMGSYYLAAGANGLVDTCYRDLRMTAAQMVEEFGLEACSASAQNAYRNGELDREYRVLHAIEPRRDRKPELGDARNKRWRSVYLEEGAEEGKLLRESGFDSFPVLAPRWYVTGNDVYGRSPAMDVLGDIKQLQVMQRRKGQAVDKQVNPPMQGGPAYSNHHVSLLPGAINVLADGDLQRQGLRSVYDVRLNLGDLRQDIFETQEAVRRGFFANLFLMISSMDRRQVTATEIAERRSEKMLALGPVLERLQNELLEPLIERTFEIAATAGILPPAPEVLQGLDLKVELQSILVRDQRVDAIQGIERLTGYAGGLAQIDPAAGMKVDWAQSVEEMGELLGVPPTILRSDEEVTVLQQQSAQRQQMAEGLAMAQQSAAALKDAGAGAQSLDGLQMLQAATGQGGIAETAGVAET
ncbi:portal protein [Algihabitans albus]|uniref:portal protein n=1 Tax=Algihabitans albus TaxID=2164067 RepID=UPI0035CEB4D8